MNFENKLVFPYSNVNAGMSLLEFYTGLAVLGLSNRNDIPLDTIAKTATKIAVATCLELGNHKS